MSILTKRDPSASIRARLLNYAKQHGADFQRVLTRYAIERLLFRLCQTEASARYVLKGAMLFLTWPNHISRPTRDLDLLGKGNPSPDAITALFTNICKVEMPEDGIIFDPSTILVSTIKDEDQYPGARVKLIGILSKAKIEVQVDIGFGDHVFPEPIRQNFPCVLQDIPAPSILMYPPETVIAEKFEAMVRFGEANSRVKDLHDIWVTSRMFPFELPNLLEAISGTLRRRGTAVPTEMPVGLAERYAAIVDERGLWRGFLRTTTPAPEPPPFRDLQEELRRFFTPVVNALYAPEGAKGRWDPAGGEWR